MKLPGKNKKQVLLLVYSLAGMNFSYAQKSIVIASPDKNISVKCNVADATYNISYKSQLVLDNSKFGLVMEDGDFSKDLKLIKTSNPATVKENYTTLNAKKKNITYTATERIIETQTASGKR